MITFPGTSVTEWVVVYGRDLTVAKRVLEVIDMTYTVFGPKGDVLPDFFEPLLFVLLWFTKRLRVGNVAIVPVQVFGENVQVHLSESFAPISQEFGLRGNGH